MTCVPRAQRMGSAGPAAVVDDQVCNDCEGIVFRNDGEVTTGTGTLLGTWLLLGAAADCEIRATVASGTSPDSGSALGLWLPLSSTRNWKYAPFPIGTKTCNLTVSIRLAASPYTVLDTGTVTITDTG